MLKSCTTEKPRISDSQLARVRAAAHRYLLAGGSVFVQDPAGGDQDAHICNVREMCHPEFDQDFEALLDKHVPDVHAHQELWIAVWSLVAAQGEAGYLFGACVHAEIGHLSAFSAATNRVGGVR